MSNKFFQSVIYQLKEAFGRPVGVIFDNDTIRSFSDMSAIENILEEVIRLLQTHRQVLPFFLLIRGRLHLYRWRRARKDGFHRFR